MKRRIADPNIWVIYAAVLLLGVAYGTSIAVLAIHLDAHGIPKLAMGGLAVLLVIASVLLISNTIRLSLFSRRREVEVMKLVGATNWFVRGPFMLEGLICGVAGALLAIFFLVVGKAVALPAIMPHLSGDAEVHALAFPLVALVLLGSGLALGAVGSGLTIRRFLRV